MKRTSTVCLAAFVAMICTTGPARAESGEMAAHGGHEATGVVDGRAVAVPYRSPGLSAALSLTPMPIDFGNFYAENTGWALAYTTLELGLMTPMVFIAGGHGGMGYSGNTNVWSNEDRNWMIGLVSSYVAVKLVSAYHASRAAESFNHADQPRLSAVIVPAPGGGMAFAALRF